MIIKTKELREKTKKEIQDLLTKTELEIKKVSASVFNGEEKDFNKPRKLRKDLARIKTILKAERSEVHHA